MQEEHHKKMKKQEMKVFTMYEGWDAEKEKPNRSTLVENPEKMLENMRANSLGKNAQIIGTCGEDENCVVQMETPFGGTRMVDWLSGEQLPRIC